MHLLILLTLLVPAAAFPQSQHDSGQHQEAAPPKGTAYACAMHPEVRSEKPGKCGKCGMTLEPEKPDDPAGPAMDDEHMDPHGREGSGTSWMPDSTPVFAHHFMAGDWMLMLHYSVLAGYDDQWSDRGSRRFTSINWVMGMASHPLLGGEVELRSMLSLEPATAGGATAIPILLQSGETYGGKPLHDRQHPHDFFMEVAALYRHALAGGFGLELYGAPAGEPALGPTAFMHRLSAMLNPFPPIGHHWQDSTHISFPVLTAGLYNRWLKLEGSTFHGREPDENRWDFDLGALDSWSARLSANPTSSTSLQISYGYLHSPEAIRPDESEHRWPQRPIPAARIREQARRRAGRSRRRAHQVRRRHGGLRVRPPLQAARLCRSPLRRCRRRGLRSWRTAARVRHSLPAWSFRVLGDPAREDADGAPPHRWSVTALGFKRDRSIEAGAARRPLRGS